MCEVHRGDGLPQAYAELLADLDELIANGAEDRVTDTVLRVTGQAPTSFEAFATREWGRAPELASTAP